MKSSKKVLLLLCLLIALPFYLTYIFFFETTSFRGDTVASLDQSYAVTIEGGVAKPGHRVTIVDLPQKRSYDSRITLDVKNPGFVTGVILKSSKGEILSIFTSYGLQDLPCKFSTDSRRMTVELYFLASRDDLASFKKTYQGYADGPALEDALDQYDFSSPIADGKRDVTFRMTIQEIVMAPIHLQVIPVALGFVFLVLLFLSLTKETSEDVTLKERFTGIGNSYAIFATAVMFTQFTVAFIFYNFFPDVLAKDRISISLLLTILSVDVIAFPLTFLACKGIPATKIEEKNLGVGKFLLFLLMCAGILGAGGVLGSLVHGQITKPFGSPDSALSMLMMNSGTFLRVLTVGICAPIFEELIFRKLLVDRLIKYGEFIAIFTSGLFFGLFHGNFQQVFFAAGLGFLFAFIYVRTGRVRYTIGLHMIINMSTSVITVLLTGKVYEHPELLSASDPAVIMGLMETQPEAVTYLILYGLWLLFICVAAIAGAITLLVFLLKKKFRLKKAEGEMTRGEALKALFGNGFVWVFLISIIGIFLNSYLPYFLNA